ncbi:MAG: hypothetical protein J6Y60_02300 [Treponema sp.]|nr:hypothetical protein [Treponema sp.]
MTFDFDSAVSAAIVSSIVSFLVSLAMKVWQDKTNKLASLDAQLDSILKIAVQYPYLESEDFTKKWKENVNNADEQYRRYETYATLVFNYLSRVCEFFHYKKKKINAYVDMDGWVELHHVYWYNPSKEGENEAVYDEKFKNLVHSILGGIPQ